MMFKNMRIKNRLIIVFIIITVVAGSSGVVSVFVTRNINDDYSYALKNYGFAQGDVGKVLACFGSINVSVHDSINYLNLDDAENVKEQYDAQLQKMDDYFNNVEATIKKAEAREAFDEAKSTWDQYIPLAEELMVEGDSADAAVVEKTQRRMVDELDPMYNTIYNALADLLAIKVEEGNTLEDSLTKSVNSSIIFVLIMLAVSVAASLVLGTLIANGIANPVRACARRLKELSEGDLRSPVPAFAGGGKNEVVILADATETIVNGLTGIIEDEKYLLGEMANGNFNIQSKATERYVGDFAAILQSVRNINQKLSDSLSQINQSSEQVSSGAQQVSTAAQNLSQGSTEQAASVEELASTIEEITKQIENNAENAALASDKAQKVGADMEESNEKMNSMMQAMEEINSSSNEIGKIIKTIEDIAFQTNILALNAAVEAARAGAAGKGFAVVADEVRSLASKSAEASKDTAVLIENSVKAVDNGSKIAEEAASVMVTAAEGAKEVVGVLEEISVASAQQADSAELVTQNVEQISGVVQTNSATAEESAASSEELSGQAQIMKELVAEFTLKED